MVLGSGAAVGQLAARLVVARLAGNPRMAIALPTGKTPLPMYRALVDFCRKGSVDFSQAHFFNLDELLGLPRTHPASYAAYLRREFFSKVNASPSHTHLLNGSTQHPLLECIRHERTIIRVGGLGLAVLGIGRNGHIAFNEPGSPIYSRTRVVRLAPETIEDNHFAPNTYALTMGIGTILQAREIILLASGPRKAQIVARALREAPTFAVPASALQLHPNVTVILDREAARELVITKGVV